MLLLWSSLPLSLAFDEQIRRNPVDTLSFVSGCGCRLAPLRGPVTFALPLPTASSQRPAFAGLISAYHNSAVNNLRHWPFMHHYGIPTSDNHGRLSMDMQAEKPTSSIRRHL